MKIKELLEYGRNNLIKKEEPYRISKIILKHLLKADDSFLVINQDETVSLDVEKKYKEYIKLLNNGKPIQYITHQQEFMKMDFYVDENVLIPQPDTEILVEEIIDICKNMSCNYHKEYSILDLCTGSGAIGIALAKNIKNAKVTMSDISEEALEVANKNIIKNQVKSKCKLIKSDMFKNINNKFDIIVSNPPYIETNIIKTLEEEVQNEPILALDGGKEGLEFYKIIAKQAYKYLNKNGILALEIGYDQKEKVIELLKKEKKYIDIYSKKDLAGNDRIVCARRI